jgi:very-short-patch-repair endonuclease
MNENLGFAKQLRRNQTDVERVHWFRIGHRRLNDLKFKRQVPIDQYAVDFCCSDARLIVELDGGQPTIQTAEDLIRTRLLEAMGYLVLRFWTNDVLQNLDSELEEIPSAVKQH